MAKIDNEGKICWTIPAGINLQELLIKHPPKKFKPIVDHFHYILDYLLRHTEFQDLDETKGYINLNAQRLQTYNRKYRYYLEYLMDRGIIRSDNRFIKGEKSRGYAIREEYLSDTTIDVPATRFVLSQKVKKDLLAIQKEQQSTSTLYSFLTKWFNHYLFIDKAAAIDTINQLFPIYRNYGAIRGKIKKKYRKTTKRYKAVQATRMLAEKQFYYKVDDNIGRFHSNLTNIKKDLRKHITYKGIPLVNIDIANAQPLFSALLLKKEFWNGTSAISIKSIPTVKQLFKSNTSYNKTRTSLLTYITLVESSENRYHKEFRDYKHMVQNGSFYKMVFENMFPEKEYDKTVIKDVMFQAFFSANRFIGQPKARLKMMFSHTYPAVYKIFRILKKDNHVILSHLLQRIESIIMIETVARRIAVERPELPFFTIHDSIATTKGNEQYIKQVMEEEIQRLTGLCCLVRVEE